MNSQEPVMPVRAAFLSAAMLLAISFSVLAVYAVGTVKGQASDDGYGYGISAVLTSSTN